MPLLIEDSPRNLLAWISEAIAEGLAEGAVVTPFASPWESRNHRRGARDMANDLNAIDADVWFDATTHALQMAGVGDFRYYNDYDLWPGTAGDLSTNTAREGHVDRVFRTQDTLGATHLAPTILLHHGESDTSSTALALSSAAVQRDPECWVSIAGTGPYWSSGQALDAHVGALAQLEPAGWFLTSVRPNFALPAAVVAEEIHGLCRTVRALAEYKPVHISHGDLAALPAVAAGATSIGTGWDQRQRACASESYTARSDDEGGGGWYQRPTLRGLCGSLRVAEAQVLVADDAALTARLGGLPTPGPKAAFKHHLRMLGELVDPLVAEGDYEARFRLLQDVYANAASDWPDVERITSSPLGADDWIAPLAAGLALYGADEGW